MHVHLTAVERKTAVIPKYTTHKYYNTAAVL